MGENARHFGNIVTSQLKDDMDIQLKPRQFHRAVNSVCAKCRWVLPDINVASKSFYSFCCSCYVCQLWDLYNNCIEDIYVVWSKATRRIFNLPCNTNRFLLLFVVGSSHIRVNLVNRFNNFFYALMSNDNKSFWCTTAISVIFHWSSIENSWMCTIVINATKSKKLMGHCFYHYWMFDVQIGLALSFRKIRLNVCFIMFVPIVLNILWWSMFWCLNIYLPMSDCLVWIIDYWGVYIFVHISMFIFLCILGTSESE